MTSHAEESTASEPEGFIARTVGWLRAGYPQGVPQQDYVALLGILRRVMSTDELEDVVAQLSATADGEPITRAMVEEQIEDVIDGPVTPDDVDPGRGPDGRRGVADVVAGGELHERRHPPGAAQHRLPGRRLAAQRATRAGYPTQDFVPLLALLRRRLTDAEVAQVAHDLEQSGTIPADRVDVGAAIIKITSELPSEEDVERVRAYLEEQGWPTDFTR